MRYFHFYGGNGYAGCDFDEYYVYLDFVTDDQLNLDAQEMAEDNAESYEYIIGEPEDYESEEEYEQVVEDYYANIEGHWEEMTEEKFMEATE